MGPGAYRRFSFTSFLGTLELLLPEKREKNWASRIRESIEEALELLRTVGILKTLDWPDGFGPGDIDRSKGWSDRWLNARICFTTGGLGPPGPSRYHEKCVERARGVGLTGTQIRFARTNIIPCWTQEGLARELKISRRHLSQIETGKRKPSPMVTKRLRYWLETRKEKELQSEFAFGDQRGEGSSSFRQTSLKPSTTEEAALNSSTAPTSESQETANVVHGRGATRQGTGAPTRKSQARTGTDKSNGPRYEE